MPVRHDRALVLQRHPWSESSLVAHVVTAAHGRVHPLARGAFRTTSRFYCGLDLFDTLDLEWNQSPGRELADLRAGDVWKRRRHVAGSLAAFRAATTVLELSDLASRFGPPDARLFALLKHGGEASREIAAGRHLLKVHNTLFWKNIELELQPGEHARFVVVNRAGWGTHFLAGTLGAGPIYLTVQRANASG
ncbi:MAG: recombination protein O N-terminal domain-containing protein [Planctomycetota bacterium]|nr:recombination protein O N-terminal domain-containing protein [Planctomycetota bacterium]